jgi:lysozyme family protein
MSDFDEAFRVLIGHEGGYVNHPKDPGGETKYGITKRTYPGEDIRNMTLARAKELYRRDFWNRVRGDDLPYPVAFQLFDGAVNSGVGNSVRWAQAAAEVATDGDFGPVTLAAIQAADPEGLLARYNGHRLKFMSDLSTWKTFGKGWARRIAGNLMAAPISRTAVEPSAEVDELRKRLKAIQEIASA